jgi:NAD+ synthase
MDDQMGCRMGQVEQMIRHAYWSSGCTGIVIGISGGIDSAVAAAFCCRAVGADRVLGLTLPSTISSPDDTKDAATLCAAYGMTHKVVSIEPILSGFAAIPDYWESRFLLGNLMARIRMAVLYYYANRDNRIVCGTSNRSEYLLGYCTKFGDNAADIQPILHLYKSDILEMAKSLDIPDRIIKKTPSAGLWAGQTDEEEIGLSYREIDASLAALERQGWQADTPAEEKVLGLVKKSTHKRVAAPSLLALQQRLDETARGN